MPVPARHYTDIYKLFCAIDTPREAEMLLKDILTMQELEFLAERWQILNELHNETPQRDIADKLGVSISKITRGSHVLKYGTGGFGYFLKKLKGK